MELDYLLGLNFLSLFLSLFTSFMALGCAIAWTADQPERTAESGPEKPFAVESVDRSLDLLRLHTKIQTELQELDQRISLLLEQVFHVRELERFLGEGSSMKLVTA